MRGQRKELEMTFQMDDLTSITPFVFLSLPKFIIEELVLFCGLLWFSPTNDDVRFLVTTF